VTHSEVLETLPEEMSRVRNRLVPVYTIIGTPAQYALGMLQHDLQRAERALADNDTAEMARAYVALCSYRGSA
jgi:hypothetical protein